MSAHQRIAVALWVLHTFVYQQFAVTPRLIFKSPVRGCGKTTALDFIKQLTFKPRKIDNITGPALFRLIDFGKPTVLLDEVDNLDLLNDGTIRAVLNGGHRKGGTIFRMIDNFPAEWSTFAPVAIGLIGSVPLP
jgi:hypothetical protein